MPLEIQRTSQPDDAFALSQRLLEHGFHPALEVLLDVALVFELIQAEARRRPPSPGAGQQLSVVVYDRHLIGVRRGTLEDTTCTMPLICSGPQAPAGFSLTATEALAGCSRSRRASFPA